MESIIEPNKLFDFNQINLAKPVGIQGGAYFTKVLYNGKSLYVKTPETLTKQGFVKSGKKIYCDLMLDNTNEEFIQWLENLEDRCHNLIFEKSENWFENALEKDDIVSAFTSPIKIYKSGKYYLLRTNVKISNTSGLPIIKIFDENECIKTIEDITNETKIISVIEVQGIKFTSRSFQLELEIKQSVILNTDMIFESCVIKTHRNNGGNISGGDKISLDTNTFSNNRPITSSIVTNTSTNMNTNINNVSNKDKLSNSILTDLGEMEELEEITDLVISEKDIMDSSVDNEYNEDEELIEKEIKEIMDEETLSNTQKNQELNKSLEKTKQQTEKTNDGLEHISLEVEDLDKDASIDLREINDIELVGGSGGSESLDTITLKKPNQVYYEIYKEARKRAKEAKQTAILAYLEAKNIKKTYMLEDVDDSSESDMENMSENGSDSGDEYEELDAI